MPSALAGAWARWRPGLATVLVGSFGTVTAVAVAATIWIGIEGAGRNTRGLLRDKAELTLELVEGRVRGHLSPVTDQARYLRGLIESGAVPLDDKSHLADALFAALSATPQVASLALVPLEGETYRVARDGTDVLAEDWRERPEIAHYLATARGLDGPTWLAPTFSERFGGPVLVMLTPLRLRGEFRGVLATTVLVTELSRFVATASRQTQQTTFVLDGEGRVLAHPGLVAAGLSSAKPLPGIGEVGDSVLARIWSDDREALTAIDPFSGGGHVIRDGGDGNDYLFLYRRLPGFAEAPWLAGAWISGREAGRELARINKMAVAGSFVLIASVLVAVWLARRIARPMLSFAVASRRIERLEFQLVPRLPRSRLFEHDEAARAFNAMLGTLRWFELYVPRQLVRRLAALGERAVAPHEREVTVIFTDITSFSRIAATMAPADTAKLLNHHFGLVCAAIDLELGTVDKYIGDSVMAFWGAPETQPDHARRACRAAVAAAAAVREDNATRELAGLAPMGLRIGIHTGRAVVGNIGAAGRINYTLVGDTVNIAERLQDLGREFVTQGEVIVLATETTVAALDDTARASSLGYHALRGRAGRIEVWRLT